MNWNDECDVLVVGSGAGGCTGAYTAAREGLSTILVEATDRVGGIAAYSGGGGMWFPCNAALRRSGDADTIEDALTYYRAVVNRRAHPSRFTRGLRAVRRAADRLPRGG